MKPCCMFYSLWCCEFVNRLKRRFPLPGEDKNEIPLKDIKCPDCKEALKKKNGYENNHL